MPPKHLSSLGQQLSTLRSQPSTVSKITPSLIFTQQVASTLDIDTIYSLSFSSIEALSQIDNRYIFYKEKLFSESLKKVDRSLMIEKDNNELAAVIKGLLYKLSSNLMNEQVQRILEYLLRNFDVNIYEAEQLIIFFLPFHATEIYTKLIQNIEVRYSQKFEFIIKNARQGRTMNREILLKALKYDSTLLDKFFDYFQQIQSFDKNLQNKEVDILIPLQQQKIKNNQFYDFQWTTALNFLTALSYEYINQLSSNIDFNLILKIFNYCLHQGALQQKYASLLIFSTLIIERQIISVQFAEAIVFDFLFEVQQLTNQENLENSERTFVKKILEFIFRVFDKNIFSKVQAKVLQFLLNSNQQILQSCIKEIWSQTQYLNSFLKFYKLLFTTSFESQFNSKEIKRILVLFQLQLSQISESKLLFYNLQMRKLFFDELFELLSSYVLTLSEQQEITKKKIKFAQMMLTLIMKDFSYEMSHYLSKKMNESIKKENQQQTLQFLESNFGETFIQFFMGVQSLQGKGINVTVADSVKTAQNLLEQIKCMDNIEGQQQFVNYVFQYITSTLYTVQDNKQLKIILKLFSELQKHMNLGGLNSNMVSQLISGCFRMFTTMPKQTFKQLPKEEILEMIKFMNEQHALLDQKSSQQYLILMIVFLNKEVDIASLDLVAYDSVFNATMGQNNNKNALKNIANFNENGFEIIKQIFVHSDQSELLILGKALLQLLSEISYAALEKQVEPIFKYMELFISHQDIIKNTRKNIIMQIYKNILKYINPLKLSLNISVIIFLKKFENFNLGILLENTDLLSIELIKTLFFDKISIEDQFRYLLTLFLKTNNNLKKIQLILLNFLYQLFLSAKQANNIDFIIENYWIFLVFYLQLFIQFLQQIILVQWSSLDLDFKQFFIKLSCKIKNFLLKQEKTIMKICIKPLWNYLISQNNQIEEEQEFEVTNKIMLNFVKQISKHSNEMLANKMEITQLISKYYKNKEYFQTLFIEYWLNNFERIKNYSIQINFSNMLWKTCKKRFYEFSKKQLKNIKLAIKSILKELIHIDQDHSIDQFFCILYKFEAFSSKSNYFNKILLFFSKLFTTNNSKEEILLQFNKMYQIAQKQKILYTYSFEQQSNAQLLMNEFVLRLQLNLTMIDEQFFDVNDKIVLNLMEQFNNQKECSLQDSTLIIEYLLKIKRWTVEFQNPLFCFLDQLLKQRLEAQNLIIEEKQNDSINDITQIENHIKITLNCIKEVLSKELQQKKQISKEKLPESTTQTENLQVLQNLCNSLLNYTSLFNELHLFEIFISGIDVLIIFSKFQFDIINQIVSNFLQVLVDAVNKNASNSLQYNENILNIALIILSKFIKNHPEKIKQFNFIIQIVSTQFLKIYEITKGEMYQETKIKSIFNKILEILTESRVYLFLFNFQLRMMQFLNQLGIEEKFSKHKLEAVEAIIIHQLIEQIDIHNILNILASILQLSNQICEKSIQSSTNKKNKQFIQEILKFFKIESDEKFKKTLQSYVVSFIQAVEAQSSFQRKIQLNLSQINEITFNEPILQSLSNLYLQILILNNLCQSQIQVLQDNKQKKQQIKKQKLHQLKKISSNYQKILNKFYLQLEKKIKQCYEYFNNLLSFEYILAVSLIILQKPQSNKQVKHYLVYIIQSQFNENKKQQLSQTVLKFLIKFIENLINDVNKNIDFFLKSTSLEELNFLQAVLMLIISIIIEKNKILKKIKLDSFSQLLSHQNQIIQSWGIYLFSFMSPEWMSKIGCFELFLNQFLSSLFGTNLAINVEETKKIYNYLIEQKESKINDFQNCITQLMDNANSRKLSKTEITINLTIQLKAFLNIIQNMKTFINPMIKYMIFALLVQIIEQDSQNELVQGYYFFIFQIFLQKLSVLIKPIYFSLQFLSKFLPFGIQRLANLIEKLVSSMPLEQFDSNIQDIFQLNLLMLDYTHEYFIMQNDLNFEKINETEDSVIQVFYQSKQLITFSRRLVHLLLKQMKYNSVRFLCRLLTGVIKKIQNSNLNITGRLSFLNYNYQKMNQLFLKMKEFFVPYMAFSFEFMHNYLLIYIEEQSTYGKQLLKSTLSEQLQKQILLCLTKCFLYDKEQQIIDVAHFEQLATSLSNQFQLCKSRTSYKQFINSQLSPCIVELFTLVNDDYKWKTLHYNILLNLRNEETEIQIGVLLFLEQLIESLGERYIVLIQDLLPFLVDTLDSQNIEVEKISKAIVIKLESVSGENIKEYLKQQ